MKRIFPGLRFFRLTALLLAPAVLAVPAPAAAQELSISAQASPQQAGVGQSIRLQITIEGKVNIQGSPSLPDLTDFQVYRGGSSTNFSFINGQVSSSLQYTYILVPKHTGTFTIGPISITHGGKVYSTQPIEVQVTPAGGQAQLPGPARPAGPSRAAPALPPPAAPKAGSAVFITTDVDRHQVYVNQPVTLTFRFFSRIPILAQPQYRPPDTTGFWAEDLPPQRTYRQVVGGADYEVTEIKTALFPTTSGELTIGPARLDVQIEDFNRRSLDPFDNSFFQNFFSSGRPVTLETKPITLQVKPIPTEGRPPDFSGTVGKWSLSAKLDRAQAKVGEAVTLEIRIFGEGNVKSVGKPELPPFTGFKVYETISSSEVQKEGDRVRGVKTYRTLLRPEVTGTLTLPTLTYSYFNPDKKKFERVQVPGLSLQVLPGQAEEAGGASLPSASAPGVKMVSRDIRYLKTRFPLTPPSPALPDLFWILGFGVPPLAVLLVWVGQRRRLRLASDPLFARRLAALGRARATLRKAQQARRNHDVPNFYAFVSQALTGYLADQLGLSRSGVTQKELTAELAKRGVNPDDVAHLNGLLEDCDYARFAPSALEGKDLEQQARLAESLLSHLGRIQSKEKKS